MAKKQVFSVAELVGWGGKLEGDLDEAMRVYFEMCPRAKAEYDAYPDGRKAEIADTFNAEFHPTLFGFEVRIGGWK